MMKEKVFRQNGNGLPPFVASDYDSLGRSLMMLEQMQEAEDAFRQSIAIAPGETESHFLLAQLLADQNRLDDAESVLRQVATTAPPDWRTWRALAVLLTRMDKHAEAAAAFEHALDAAASVDTQFIIAPLLVRLLATSPDDAVRDIPRALSIAQQSCDATEWSEPSLIDVLASVHFEAGQIQDAIRLGEQALSLAQQKRQSELAEQIAQRIDQYRAAIKAQP